MLFRAGAACAVGAGLALAGGCSSEHSAASGSLTAGDFRAPDADKAPETAAMSERRAPVYHTEPADTTEIPHVTVLTGAPALDTAPAAPATQSASGPVMMDSLIGDINGTPLYATAFFAPIDARLAGTAVKYRNNEQAWQAEAKKIIATQLGDMIRDEMLLAEARASLTPEQKQGLLSFIEQVRRDLVSQGGGGQAAVDENLREQGEKGLDAKLKENIDRQLIYSKLREKILPRATVSWHEVQVEYERRAEKFNPDPTAVFRVIRIATKDTAHVEGVKNDLAHALAFEEIAEREENDFPDGGLFKQTFKGEYAKAPLFGIKELNTAAQALQPGGVAGPFTAGAYTAWVKLEKIDTPKAKSIYEAQLAIYNELREAKVKAETEKYLSGLLLKQSYTKLNDMSDKLLSIANERYYSKGR